MEKFQNVLSKFGFTRGGSSDELEVARRSSQSTPRMSRARVRDASQDAATQQQHRAFGSLGNMEVHRVNRVRERSWESDRINRVHLDQNQAATTAALTQAALNRSWDMDKVPALDRNWELERARGMEMVYRSMEKEKERRLHQAQTQAHGHRQKEGKKKKRKRDKSKESQAMMEQIDNNKLSQERLERRIDELNRMLLEEKHQNRKDKLAVAKLQQEVARQKSDRSIRETLMKELDRERMLRLDAERRLRDSDLESENYKARLLALQDEFKKMEEMARTLLQYKNKVDQLKQEKATLSISYEKNMQKFRTEISNLEHENKIVTAELKRLETECDNCQQCNKDLSYRVTKPDAGQSESSDKVKMLLERLKRLEEEKSQLVLENENQRQQYEKCLDEIANQVVQALLSQKGLREECGKLQKRVMDLEEQNRQLKDMFHQRIKFASDSFLQAMSSKSKLEPGVHSDQSLEQTKYLMLQGLTGSCDSITPLSQISLGSLQSICSNYQESNHTEDNDPGKPKPSSPPSWLRDQIIQKTDSPSSSLCSPATVETMLSTTLPHKSRQTANMTAQNPGQLDPVHTEGTKTGAQHANPAKTEASLFQGHLVISHSGSQSAFYPVAANGISPQAGEGAALNLTNQIPQSDQAHLHMLHMQNIALQQQRMHLVGSGPIAASDLGTRPLQQQVGANANNTTSANDLQNDLAFPVTDIDTKLISSIQNAKKRFSQGRLQGVTIDSTSGSNNAGGRTGSASHTETEFPADNTSPKMKHTSPFNSPTSSESMLSPHSQQNPAINGVEEGYKLTVKSPTPSFASPLIQSSNGYLTNPQDEQMRRRNEGQAEALLPDSSSSRPKPVKLYLNGRPGTSSSLERKSAKGKPEVSPGKELLKMSDAFNEKLLLEDKGGGGMPKIGDFLDSDSDDSEASRPLSKNLSMASTMSLNELLEKGLENISTPIDENFSIDNFQIFDSDEEGDFKDPIERMKLTLSKGNKDTLGSAKCPNSDPHTTSQTVRDKKGNRFLVNMKKNEQSEKDYGDYVCLKKIKEYVFMNMPDVLEKTENQSTKTSSKPTGSPADCISPSKGCSVSGGDCKSSQTSPEEVCQCGSCDNVFLSCDQLNHNSDSRKSSRSNSKSNMGRPNDLHLHGKSSSEGYNGKHFKTGSLKRMSNKVSPESNNTAALNSSYHDYVNLTPEMVQEILSRESTPSREFANLRKSSETTQDLNAHSRSVGSNSRGTNRGMTSCHRNLSNGAIEKTARSNDNSTSKDHRAELSCNDSGIADSQNTSKLSEVKLSEVETGISSSPDSAMQRSYASTASSVSDKGEHLSLERLKYQGKDEGYSSNSANSVKTESVLDMATVTKETIVKDTRGGEINSNCNNNIKATKRHNSDNSTNSKDATQKMNRNSGRGKVQVEAEVHAHYEKMGGSLTSLHSVSSVESECNAGKIQGIKDYVEGKMEEVRRSLEYLDHTSPPAMKKGLRHVPKTSPYHHRPHSCSPQRGGAGLGKLTAVNQTRQVPLISQPTSSLIPKPCLIKHVLRRSHSMSCVIQMTRSARIPCRKTPSYDSLKRNIPECSKGRITESQNGISDSGSRFNGPQESHVTRATKSVSTGYIGHMIKQPSYKSTQMTPNKMKMGISYRRKSETQEEKRIVGEGSETGYRSREELRPEGVVIRTYEEEEGSVGQTSVRNPALHQFRYKPSKDSTLPNVQSSCHNRTKYKPVHVNLNQLEPDDSPVYSSSNQSYNSLSGDSSSLEESIQLLNGIGLPQGLDDLEKQYNLMQENLKVKLNSFRNVNSDFDNWQMSQFSHNKSKSLDCIGYLSKDGLSDSATNRTLGYSKSSLGLHITDADSCSLENYTEYRQVQDDIRKPKDEEAVFCKDGGIGITQDNISEQIESLSRTVEDIQRSLSSLSIDTLVDEEEVADKKEGLHGEGEMERDSWQNLGRKPKNELNLPKDDGSMDTLVDEDQSGVDEADVNDVELEDISKQEAELVGSGMLDEVIGQQSRNASASTLQERHPGKTKKDSSFLANLILLGVSDNEEEGFTSGDSDVFWDSPVQSWHIDGSGEDPDKLEQNVPLSLLNDLSPSPTCPRSSGEFPQFKANKPSIKSQQDLVSTFHKHVGGSYVNTPEIACSGSIDFCEPFYRNGEAANSADVREEKLLPFHVDKFVDSSAGVRDTVVKPNILSLFDSEEESPQKFSFAEWPINERVAKLREESRLENDTNIHRLSDAKVDSASHLYKAVLSNGSFQSKSDPAMSDTLANLKVDAKLSNASSNLESSSARSNNLCDSTVSNASSKANNDVETGLSSNSYPQSLSKFDCLLYKTLNQSFESPESSVGVDGISLSDSCCGSLSGQESE